MAKVELKQPKIDEISALLSGATAVVLVNYQGITVEADTRLRKALREGGVTYRVYKNTYLNRAMKGTVFEKMAPDLNGPTAIAVTKGDATSPARIVTNFDRKGEVIQLKAGVVEGTYYDAKGIAAVALVPSREILLGRLFGSMKSPMASFARVVREIAEAKAGGKPETKSEAAATA